MVSTKMCALCAVPLFYIVYQRELQFSMTFKAWKNEILKFNDFPGSV